MMRIGYGQDVKPTPRREVDKVPGYGKEGKIVLNNSIL
jgi:hypothetical protein